MSTNFSTSETRLNLMRAFAGESQARSRYTLAQEKAQQQGQYVLSALFKFTATIRKRLTRKFFTSIFPSFRAARSRSMAAILLTFLAGYVIF